MRELRVWKRHDWAADGYVNLGQISTTTVQAPDTYKGIIGAWKSPTTPGEVQDFVVPFTNGGFFSIGLGGERDIDEVWVYLGNNYGQASTRVMFSFMYNACPSEGYPPR